MFNVVLNSCVLRIAPVRDVLVRTHARGLYRACWSERILQETAASEPNHPVLALAALFPDSTIPRDHYEPLAAATRSVPDTAGDAVALCVRAHAEVLVAMSANHFPDELVAPLGIECQHPDEFLSNLLDLSPPIVLEVLMQLAADTRRRPLSLLRLVEILGRTTPNFAERVLYHLPADMQSP